LALSKPPQTEAELLHRAKLIAGLSISHLAKQQDVLLPKQLLRAKGFVGQLLERHLVTTAGNKAVPDFEQLQIELKTIPVYRNGVPRETTYVCRVPLLNYGLSWRESVVYKKLARVLWIPIEAEEEIALGDRKIGSPLLWSPSQAEESILARDWEELMEMVSCGSLTRITAYHGTYLQVRPKAAHSRVLRLGVGEGGAYIKTLPLGFYLRTSFTKEILQAYYLTTR
jgi:DNA mismatch repair protein MutH